MKPEDIKSGLKVKTISVISTNATVGFLIDKKFLQQRKPNQLATVYGHVDGHGGDVWWLVHEGATLYKKTNETGEQIDMIDKSFIAPYMFTEFMPIKE